MRPERLPNQSTLPTETSTKSFWHQDPSSKLLGHRTTKDLPDSADVIVVGSGITGAFAAMELVNAGRKVVMLEAREACWGATGRNGGHCQPILYASSPEVAEFELATFYFFDGLVKAHSIPCDWTVTGGVSAFPTEALVSAVEEHLVQLDKTHPHLARLCEVVRDPEALRRLNVKEAKGAVTQVYAAKCWPYKLVSWVLEQLLSKHSEAIPFNLQTTTPVTHLQRAGESWIVHTPRGQIASKSVLLCTNAYTSAILPQFTNLIVPVRGQVAALTPPKDYTLLNRSHAFVGPGTGSEDYLLQRDEGPLIFGGERFAAKDKEFGVSDDSTINQAVAKTLRCVLPGQVELSSSSSSPSHKAASGNDCLDAEFEWTGIMGYSGDSSPWVGAVPPSLGGGNGGLWMAAGYTGHGMPVAARCGIAAAERILGKTEGVVNVPAPFEITEERVRRIRNFAACSWGNEDAERELLATLKKLRA